MDNKEQNGNLPKEEDLQQAVKEEKLKETQAEVSAQGDAEQAQVPKPEEDVPPPVEEAWVIPPQQWDTPAEAAPEAEAPQEEAQAARVADEAAEAPENTKIPAAEPPLQAPAAPPETPGGQEMPAPEAPVVPQAEPAQPPAVAEDAQTAQTPPPQAWQGDGAQQPWAAQPPADAGTYGGYDASVPPPPVPPEGVGGQPYAPEGGPPPYVQQSTAGQTYGAVPPGAAENAAGQPWQQPGGAAAPPEKKKKKTVVIVLVAVLALAALVLLFVFVVRPLIGTGVAVGDTEPYTHNAELMATIDQEMVLWKSDGTVVETGLVAEDAATDAAGDNIAYIDEDGVLYWYDVASTEQTRVADDASTVIDLPFGKYLLYSYSENATVEEILQAAAEEDGNTLDSVELYFSVLFEERTVEEALQVYEMLTGEEYLLNSGIYLWNRESGESEELFSSSEARGEAQFTYRLSMHGEQMAYVNSANDIVLMDKNGAQTILGQASKDAAVLFSGVPDQGNLVVWRAQDDRDMVSVYAYIDGVDDKLFTVDDDYYVSDYVVYNSKGDRALVYSNSLEEIYEIGSDGTLEPFRVDGEKISDIIVNNATYMPPENFDSFYVVTYDGDEEYILYHINADRERDKVVAIEGIYPIIRVCGEQIYYIDGEDNLYTRRWEGNAVGDPEKIASDVYEMQLSADGQTVWYTKGEYRDETIYRYVNGESERIDQETTSLYISPDGNTAVYLRIPQQEENEDISLGTLCLYENGETRELASDVPAYTMSTYYRGGYINPDLMYFLADVYEDEDEELAYGTLYVARGGEAERQVQDILFESYEY
ncbi:hypothetical protein LJC49_06095 [Ruminococcaceae bacterium OttesenSCG-928-I18]|nr:hypothetical protein [Ruminococcaceae bacterium OttesenSCG-928-I18]